MYLFFAYTYAFLQKGNKTFFFCLHIVKIDKHRINAEAASAQNLTAHQGSAKATIALAPGQQNKTVIVTLTGDSGVVTKQKSFLKIFQNPFISPETIQGFFYS